jgi:CspA family cold shock protein
MEVYMANYTGIIKWFDDNRGYGFISANDGQDIFVHRSQIKEKGNNKSLSEGQSVTFDTAHNKNGLNAINVKIL